MIDRFERDIEQLRNRLQSIFRILAPFRYLSDSYIIEFFVNNLWSQLPCGWRTYLDSIDFQELADLLAFERPFRARSCQIPPLSLLALRKCSGIYSLRRKPAIDIDQIDQLIELDRSIDDGDRYENRYANCGGSENHRGEETIDGTGVKNRLIFGGGEHLIKCDQLIDHASGNHVVNGDQPMNCDQMISRESNGDRSNDHHRNCFSILKSARSDENSDQAPSVDQSTKSYSNRIEFKSSSATSDRSGKRLPLSQALLHMNPKKSHEICRLADLIDILMRSYSFENDRNAITVVDVGSGCGHLARYLSLIKGIRTITIESKAYFIDRAKIFDQKIASKLRRSPAECGLPAHQNDFFNEKSLETARSIAIGDQNGRTWMIGLHTCGDLATSMLRSFVKDPLIEVVLSISCCYMKLTTDFHDRSATTSIIPPDRSSGTSISSTDRSTDMAMNSFCRATDQSIDIGYPMSDFTKSIDHHELAYAAREMSCHGLEQYVIKLRSMDDHYSNSLKIHCYRAALETLITRKYPDRRREGIRNVKNVHGMTLREYAQIALSKLDDIDSEVISEGDQIKKEWAEMIDQWKRVVFYFSIRLLLAPLIESAILIDRLLFLKENGCMKSWILPVFDPEISARNFMILAMKENENVL